MRLVRSVRDVVARYDAVLCDIWGVLHDGVALYPGVADALTDLRRSGLVVVLVSNVPRPGRTVVPSLAELGLSPHAWDAIVTSGDVIRPELGQRAPGPVHRLGRTGDAGLWEDLGLEFAPLDLARFLAIAGLRPREVPADYADVLRAARARDLELLCANPDIQVQSGDSLAWCAGAVARDYEALGGRVVQTGKPHAPIYERARDAIDRAAGRPVPGARVLAVGDGITTDVLGANRAGVDCLFIGTGMNGDSLVAGGQLDPVLVQRALAGAGVHARYAAMSLA